MSDARGTFEHAQFSEPRFEHGYCTDDMARVLLVAVREPDPDPAVRNLVTLSLQFLRNAQGANGMYRNRLHRQGHWIDRPTVEDCWGRSVWGLGTAAAQSDDAQVREDASAQLVRAVHHRSPWSRAMAFATVGSAELLATQPDNHAVRRFLCEAAKELGGLHHHAAWPWPEARLFYANAVLPEAMLAAGAVLEQPSLVQQGLDLLGWLLELETRDGHLSLTPVGGAGPGDHGPSFDQQPIEVATLADACARAGRLDDDHRWTNGVTAAAQWFLGDNDGQVTMWDPKTGGGYDGLQANGPNLNQGTESTLALLSTWQQAQRLVTVPQ